MSKLNQVISRVLSVGLIASVVLLAVGVILTLARPELPVVHNTSLSQLPSALRGGRPGGFFVLGLLVLLATPVARVIALLAGFSRRRMWLFALVSLIVLVLLGVSAYVGLVA